MEVIGNMKMLSPCNIGVYTIVRGSHCECFEPQVSITHARGAVRGTAKKSAPSNHGHPVDGYLKIGRYAERDERSLQDP